MQRRGSRAGPGGARREGCPPARLSASPARGWRFYLPPAGGTRRRRRGPGFVRLTRLAAYLRRKDRASRLRGPASAGGSGTAACIGAITVSARPRWRPEDVRGSAAGSGPGVPGEAAPGTRRGTTSAPPTGGEGGGAQVSACACPPAGIRPGSGPGSCPTPLRDKDLARGRAALAPRGSSARGHRHPHQGDRPCDCLQPGSPFTGHTYSCSPAPPSQPIPTSRTEHGGRWPSAVSERTRSQVG